MSLPFMWGKGVTVVWADNGPSLTWTRSATEVLGVRLAVPRFAVKDPTLWPGFWRAATVEGRVLTIYNVGAPPSTLEVCPVQRDQGPSLRNIAERSEVSMFSSPWTCALRLARLAYFKSRIQDMTRSYGPRLGSNRNG